MKEIMSHKENRPDTWTDVQVAEFMHGLIRKITEGTLRSWEPRHFLAVIKEQREKCKPQITLNE